MSNFYDFIEIGTSDFGTLLQKSDGTQKGISIDPLKYFLERLPDKPNCHKVCCAILDEEGEEEMYYITQETIDKYNLPNFVRGCGSIGGKHPFIKILLDNKSDDHPIGRVLDPKEIYTVEKVPVRRLKSIIDEYSIDEIKILKVDTEGSDAKILLDYMKCCRDEGYPKPFFIQFEHILIDVDTKSKVINLILEQGYRMTQSNVDDVCFVKAKI